MRVMGESVVGEGVGGAISYVCHREASHWAMACVACMLQSRGPLCPVARLAEPDDSVHTLAGAVTVSSTPPTPTAYPVASC